MFGGLAGVAVLAASVAFAQYEKQVEYLQNLRSPLRPTGDHCKAMSAAFSDATQKLNHAHDQCLNSGGSSQPSGKTCSKASCQNLHTLRDYAQERAAAESKVCNERARLVEAEQRQWEAQVRASQEAHRQQVQQAQQRAVSPPPAVQRSPLPVQQPAPAAVASSPPTRSQVPSSASAPEKTAVTRLCESLASAETCASIGPKIEGFWNDPMTQATVENLKNATAAAAESGVHDVRPGLSAPAISTVGGAVSAVGGVVTNVGIGALDPEVAKGVQAIWERRGGRHPADKILAEDEWNYASCATLDNAGARQRLAEHDQARYLQLWNSCKK